MTIPLTQLITYSGVSRKELPADIFRGFLLSDSYDTLAFALIIKVFCPEMHKHEAIQRLLKAVDDCDCDRIGIDVDVLHY